jgi:hypothetical protein
MPDLPSTEASSDNVTIDDDLFVDFCKHLSSSLNVVDFLSMTRQLADEDFDPRADDPIALIVLDPILLTRLIELRYSDLVLAFVQRLRVPESCADVFLSELDARMCDLFFDAIGRCTQDVSVEVREGGFIVHCPAGISDFIISPIGRVHHEILQSLNQVSKWINAVGINQLVLNAKAPTPESQYVQMWVASRLGIPSPEDGVFGVV